MWVMGLRVRFSVHNFNSPSGGTLFYALFVPVRKGVLRLTFGASAAGTVYVAWEMKGDLSSQCKSGFRTFLFL